MEVGEGVLLDFKHIFEHKHAQRNALRCQAQSQDQKRVFEETSPHPFWLKDAWTLKMIA